MSRKSWFALFATLAVIVAGLSLYSQFRPFAAAGQVIAPPSQAQAFIVRLGIGDTTANGTVWDGNIALSAGTILRIEGWRFDGTDTITGNSWKLSTRLSQGISGPGPIYENGIIVTATPDASATFTVDTAQGNFTFQPKNLSLGTATTFLSKTASVEPVPVSTNLTGALSSGPQDQDYPAVAQNGDDVWVTYVEFTHSNLSQESFAQLKAAPSSYDYLARSAGGDQVFLMHYSKSTRAWDAPIAVSGSKQDVMRTAVAVDGQNRVWVFWSANVNGNFDIYTKCYKNGASVPLASSGGSSLPLREQRRFGGNGGLTTDPVQLTTDPGTDVNPVATTDSNGRVWVAWQGFRNGALEVLAMVQNGSGFLPETAISVSSQDNWDPAIAAGANGEVTVSFDTYDKGDFDVYFRRLSFNAGIQMQAPVPVAASTAFEARSSVVYDKQNRLWVAYELSLTRWGKDWGAYDTTGVALYNSHTVKVKCFDGSQAYTTAVDVSTALPKPITMAALPDPTLAAKRTANNGPGGGNGAKHSFPRLAVDPDGQIYLAFRRTTGDRNEIGTIWEEKVVYYDGAKWNGSITIAPSANLLDNRPALTALGAGDVLLVSAMDHRQSPVLVNGSLVPTNPGSIENDIYAAELQVPRTQQSMALTSIPAETVAPPESDMQAERDQVALMRNYRVTTGGQTLQVLRGQFHRHSEISWDGGGDGPLVDQYRYLLDADSQDWAMCCDHDNGTGREYSWWIVQKYTDAYLLQNRYTPLFGYERSVGYPEGHRNVLFAQRGVRPLPRLPLSSKTVSAPAPDTLMLYAYVKQFNGVVASHTSGTDMGTDWRDNDPTSEPVVEIYQGDRQNYEMPGAPRSNSATDSIGGWEPLGFVSLALQKGYRLAFESSSDHVSTHMSYANVYATEHTRQGLMDALAKRHVYASTDNILADVECGNNFMGDEFSVAGAPVISVKLQGTATFSNVYVIKDGAVAYSVAPGTAAVSFTWKDTQAVSGKTSYYYVRGDQSDGELVWASPMWITSQ